MNKLLFCPYEFGETVEIFSQIGSQSNRSGVLYGLTRHIMYTYE